MNKDILKNGRLTGLFLLAFLLFNHPVITIFNLDRFWFGMPLFYIYIFLVWILVISGIMAITGR